MAYKSKKKRKEYAKSYRERHPIKYKRSIERSVKKNRAKYQTKAREFRRQQRKDVLSVLGNKCVRCGFSDIRALQIDHVKGGGVKELRGQRGHTYFRRVIKHFRRGGKRYQLLCANCNWIKRSENKEERQPEKFYGR